MTNYHYNDREKLLIAIGTTAARETLAAWMIGREYSTGHGDTLEDLLQELASEIDERITMQECIIDKQKERINTAVTKLHCIKDNFNNVLEIDDIIATLEGTKS